MQPKSGMRCFGPFWRRIRIFRRNSWSAFATPSSRLAIASTARSCVRFFSRPKMNAAFASSQRPSLISASVSSPRHSKFRRSSRNFICAPKKRASHAFPSAMGAPALRRASTPSCFPIRSNSPSTTAKLPQAPGTPKRSLKFSASSRCSMNSRARSKRTAIL